VFLSSTFNQLQAVITVDDQSESREMGKSNITLHSQPVHK